MWKVLIVEDECLIALDLSGLIRELIGAEAEVVWNVPLAFRAIERRLDFVFLDLKLNGVDTFDLARHLLRRRIAFAFVTGISTSEIPHDLQKVPLIAKPFSSKDFASALLTGLGIARRPPHVACG